MNGFLKICLVALFTSFAASTFAQQNNKLPVNIFPVMPNSPPVNDTTSKYINGVRQEDISDVIARLFKKSRIAKVDSVTSKPIFSYVPAIGYTLVSKLALVVSGNVTFRTGPQSRISTIVGSSSITQRRQFTLPIQTSIWSKDNTYNFVGDYRLFRYPQSTFGLGSGSNIKDEDPMDYAYFQFYETVLRHVSGDFYMGGGYIIDDHWNVTDKGTIDGAPSGYAAYGKNSHSIASGFTLNTLFDSRDNAINPQKGAFITTQYRDNLSFLGSSSRWSSLILDVRKYIRFPANSGNVLALWSYDWLTLKGRPAYLDLPSTQWDEASATGRGYIQGRFRGAQMVYLESEYRFRITNDGLIGGTFFVNGQSVSSAPGSKLQQMQPGYGPGLRIKLSKVTNTNICVDYGFGRQGSNGLFIDVGEIF